MKQRDRRGLTRRRAAWAIIDRKKKSRREGREESESESDVGSQDPSKTIDKLIYTLYAKKIERKSKKATQKKRQLPYLTKAGPSKMEKSNTKKREKNGNLPQFTQVEKRKFVALVPHLPRAALSAPPTGTLVALHDGI